MNIVTCFLVTVSVYIVTGKRIKPPIPEELKAACRGAGGGKRACLDEKLKEFCQEGSNTDTITCKIVRLKTLIPVPIAGKIYILVNVSDI